MISISKYLLKLTGGTPVPLLADAAFAGADELDEMLDFRHKRV